MKLPKKNFKIKIAPLTFTVNYVKDLRTPAGKRGNGHIHMINQKIRIADDLTEERTEMTFLHEALHGILKFSGLAPRIKEGITEEELVRELTPVLYGFLKDNFKMSVKLESSAKKKNVKRKKAKKL